MFGDERFKRYGCSEPGYYFRKGMVVQQDFEKGREAGMDQCAEFRRPAALVPNQGTLPEGGKRREHKPQRIAEKSSNSVEATSWHVTSMPLPVGRPSARNPSNYRCADEVQMTVVSGAADEPDREHLYTQIKDPPLSYDDSEYVKMTANCSTDEYVEMKGGVSEDEYVEMKN
eukprot:Em0011g746a